MARSDSFGPDEVFTTLFGDDPDEIDAAAHPSEETLEAYLSQRASGGTFDPQSWLAQVRGDSDDDDWSRQAMTAHLMICRACRERYHELKTAEATPVSIWDRWDGWRRALREAFAPTPRPAMVAIATQSLVIVGLAAVVLTGGMSVGPPGPASSDGAPTAASSSSASEAETQSVEPSERSESASGRAAGDSALPDPAAEQIQVLSDSGDPQARLVAAQELQNWADPSLVPELTQILRQESNPQVQQALNRTINAIMNNMATRYDRAMRSIREFEGAVDLPTVDLQIDAERLLSRLMGDAPANSSNGSAYSGSLNCSASDGLTLAQLRRLSSELGGRMVIDASMPAENFRMQLPMSAGLAESLRQLEEELGLRCYQE